MGHFSTSRPLAIYIDIFCLFQQETIFISCCQKSLKMDSGHGDTSETSGEASATTSHRKLKASWSHSSSFISQASSYATTCYRAIESKSDLLLVTPFLFIYRQLWTTIVCHPSPYFHLLPIPDGVVAFTAKLAEADSYPTHSGILKFANVSTNEGGAYNHQTGIFTCPREGIYHFENGETVVSLYDTSLPDKCSQVSSVSCVVKLARNDNVWVSTYGPGRNDFFATAENSSVFVGYCLG